MASSAPAEEDMSDGEGGEEDEDGEAGGAGGGDEEMEDDSIHLFEGHTCESRLRREGCSRACARGLAALQCSKLLGRLPQAL